MNQRRQAYKIFSFVLALSLTLGADLQHQHSKRQLRRQVQLSSNQIWMKHALPARLSTQMAEQSAHRQRIFEDFKKKLPI